MADRPTPSSRLRTAADRWWRRVRDEPRRPLALTTAAVLAAGLIALDGGIADEPDSRDPAGGLAPVTYVEESALGCADDVSRWLQESPDTNTVMYEVGTTSPKFMAFVQVNSLFQANAVQYGVDRASRMASADIAEECMAAYPSYTAAPAVPTPVPTRASDTYDTGCPAQGCTAHGDLDSGERAEILASLNGLTPPEPADCEAAGQELTSHLSSAEVYPLLREHGCGYWLDSYGG